MKTDLIKLNSKPLVLLLIITLIFACKTDSKKQSKDTPTMSLTEEQLYRPDFHFSPKKNWMNDPNGMFYFNETYHLFFQYYPEDNVWGPMHWGHATSKDLINWEEQEIALYPDDLGYIFSGSAVVDVNNTSGFGEDGKTPIVAIFTYHNIEGERAKRVDFQSQAIAYSLDEGKTWTKYEGNPVISNPGIKDFRDPKVTWDAVHEQWIMALTTYGKTLFYSSKNLREWNLLSSFGEYIGAHGGVWECPDFFQMQVEGTNETKWVLLQSLNPGHINGGSGTQYFVGDFDGEIFTLDTYFNDDLKEKQAIWLDYGRDNYAGVTWSNVPEADGRTLFIGWMSNWDYAQVVPTETWRSTMTLARSIKLIKSDDNFRLFSEPVNEINAYKTQLKTEKNKVISQNYTLIEDSKINTSVIQLKLNDLKDEVYSFSLKNDKGNEVIFGINNKEYFYFIDRSKSGDLSFSEKFANKVSKAPFNSTKSNVEIEIIIDKTSFEIFYNNGETVMTEIMFPEAPFNTLNLNVSGEDSVTLEALTVDYINLKN